MLTTNQVPFIAQVSVIPYSGYEGSNIYCTKCYITQILINHLTSKVLRVNKIKMIRHVNNKLS